MRVRKRIKRILLTILAIAGVLLLLLLGATLYLNHYLRSEKHKNLKELFPIKGEIIVDRVAINLFEHFPRGTIKLQNLTLLESEDTTEEPPLFVKNAEVVLSLKDWKKKEIAIKKIIVDGLQVNVFKDSLGVVNLDDLLQTTSGKKQQNKSNLKWILDELEVAVQGATLNYREPIRNKDLGITINKLNSEISIGLDTLARSTLDAHVRQLGFNTLKGSYLTNTDIHGTLITILDDGIYKSFADKLNIAGMPFYVEFAFPKDKDKDKIITLIKTDTEAEPIKPLLTANIQKAIKNIHITDPFYTYTTIRLIPNNRNPEVTILFNLKENAINVGDLAISDANLKAIFYNRIYTDERRFAEDLKNIRLEIESFTGQTNNIPFNVSYGKTLFSPEIGTKISIDLNANGKTKDLNSLLQNENFLFDRGNFELTLEANDAYNNLPSFITNSTIALKMDHVGLEYSPSKAHFEFDQIAVDKINSTSAFTLNGSTAFGKGPYSLSGRLENIGALIFPDRKGAVSSQVDLYAKNLTMNDLQVLFGNDKEKSSNTTSYEKGFGRELKETLQGIYQTFQPTINVAVDNFFVTDKLSFSNVRTSVGFQDRHTLVLKESGMQFGAGVIGFDGFLNIEPSNQTIFCADLDLKHMDLVELLPKVNYFGIPILKQMEHHADNLDFQAMFQGVINDKKGLDRESVHSEIYFKSHDQLPYEGHLVLDAGKGQNIETDFRIKGNPSLINEFLGNDDFVFENGDFDFQVRFKGDVTSKLDLVQKSELQLQINNSELYSRESDIVFPITAIEIKADNDNAAYRVFLKSDSLGRQIDISGNVQNISEIAFENTGKQFSVTADVASPKLVWSDFVRIFSSRNNTNVSSGYTTKETVRKIMKDFRPQLSFAIDTLQFSNNFQLHQVKGRAFGTPDSLSLSHTQMYFKEGSIVTDIGIGLAQDDYIPFDLQLHANQINVSKLLSSLDYLNISDIRNAEKLNGILNLGVSFNGVASVKGEGLKTNMTNAKIDYELIDAQIAGYRPIEEIARKVWMKKRLQHLMLAPVKGTIILDGPTWNIPRTEIQSNAVQLFVDGKWNSVDGKNLWISVPVKKLLQRPTNGTPQKTGFSDAGKKIYLELMEGSQKKPLKVKLHLGKRAYIEQRKEP